jgi:hypothetical protein
MVILEIKPWTMMYGGAFACALLSVGLIYVITVTKNASYEAFIYVLLFLSIGFAAGGYFIERKYKKEHPEEFELDEPDE